MKQHIKKSVFFFFLALLALPALQYKFELIPIKPLGGHYEFEQRPAFTWDTWVSMQFQQKYEKFVNDNIGFRELFVRSYNQVWFSLFHRVQNYNVVLGRNNVLYEENYITDYLGLNFRGEDSINDQLLKVKYLQDTLAKLNKHLILFFAPGKASYYPDEIPASYRIKEQPQTNYKFYTKRCKELGLNYIDMNGWFVSQKTRSPYPLYKPGGIHWTVYGMTLAFDSLNRYMGNLQGAPLPTFHIDNVEWSDTARDADNDVEKSLNLLFNLPYGKYAYPILSWKEGPTTKKPTVLTIADSYWWNVYGVGYTPRAYNGNNFWFYNQQAYFDNGAPMASVDTISIKEEIQKTDFIIVLATEANYHRFGFGFIERLYDFYTGKGNLLADKRVLEKALLEEIRIIREDANWMALIQKKAKDSGQPIDSVLRKDAQYMLDQKKTK
jgi:hypothetical protein